MAYRLFIILFLFFTPLIASQAQEGYRIRIEMKGMQSDTAYLANYLGKKLYYYDTAYAQKPGVFIFTGKDPIKPGVYAFVSDKRNRFQLIASEQRFTLKTRSQQPVRHMKVKGSENNRIFYDYMRHLRKEKSKARPIRNKLKQAKGERKKELREKLDRITQGVRDYQRKIAKKHQDLLVGSIVRASIPVDEAQVPDSLSKKEARRYKYEYYKKHYFDHLDLSDERMVRTPTLGRKVNDYFKRMVPDQPDSVIAAADRIMAQVDTGTEMYKYMANYITNKYMNSDIMGMDAVFVHMVENYYMDGKAFWAKEKHLKNWKDRVEKIKPLLIGKQAPLITLADTSGKNWVSLENIDAKYTILYFWDPECGHCQEVTPKLKKAYDSLKSRGVEVYAVGTPRKTKKWKDYIRKHDLNWINVSHTPEILNNPNRYAHVTDEKSLNFHKTYDIYSTPRIFLLDEDKTIIAKKLGVDQVVNYVERLLEQDGKDASSVKGPRKKKGSMQRP